MIVCPKCNKENHLILEQPSWYVGKLNKISLSCYCTECEIDFDVVALLSSEKVIKSSIKKKEYPYSC